MIKKALAAVGLTAAAVGMTAAPAMAIGDSDGHTGSLQGDGGTNFTGTMGNHSPNFHFLDNPNICLPQIKDVQVANLVAVQVPVGAGNQNSPEICDVGQTTHGTGDAAASHLVG